MALWSCCSLARSVSEGSPRVPCPSLWSHSERSSDMAHMTGARSCITHLTGGCRLEASAEQTMVRYETSWTLGSSKRCLKVEKLSSSGHVALTGSCKMPYLFATRIAIIGSSYSADPCGPQRTLRTPGGPLPLLFLVICGPLN